MTLPALPGRAALAAAALASAAMLAYPVARPAAAAPAPGRPNIVLILADDMGWGDAGFNGRRAWKTPALERLAREGTVFARWYAAAPVCAPSRAALMTGRYGIHNGVSGNAGELPRGAVTIARALRPLGYATALVGKWHAGVPRPGERAPVHPLDRGFDEFFGFTDAVHAWQHFPKQLWDGRSPRPVSGHADSLFAERSIDFIRRQRGRPFFLYLALNSPHFRIEAPADDVASFRGRFAERDPARPRNAAYAAMLLSLDRVVGRVLRALDEQRLADDTLVVFTSDNGATFEAGNRGASAYHDSNAPLRGQKRSLWEGGIRVPAVVRWPGRVPAGKTCREPIHMTDVFPTLLAAAGGAPEPAWRLDGLNVLATWTRGRRLVPRTLFWEWRAEGYQQIAVMRDDRKVIVTGEEPPEMYDVERDPGERINVFADHPRTGSLLLSMLRTWLLSETAESRTARPGARPPVPVPLSQGPARRPWPRWPWPW